MRKSRGATSFRSSRRFPASSGAIWDKPVMFLPGRARLATNPEPTGSLSSAITMGIVTVAALAGRVDAAPAVTIASTLRRTSSAARSGSRSDCLGRSPLNDNVLPLHVPELAQSLSESFVALADGISR